MSEPHVVGVVGPPSAEAPALIHALTTRKPVPGITASIPREFPVANITLASGSSVAVQYVHCATPSTLLELNPRYVLVAFSPVHAETKDAVKTWGAEVDRLFPRPRVVVCGTRLDQLGNRKVVEKMKTSGNLAMSPEECVDLAASMRAAGYYEVSHATATNLQLLDAGLAKAIVGEADKRPTPEMADEQRSACIAAGSRMKRSVWVARRHKANGRLFYFNAETRTSQWTRPRDFDGDEPEMTEAERRTHEEEMLIDEEARRKREREGAVLAAQMKEVAEHEQRMREMEVRTDTLTADIARLQAVAEGLREQGQKTEQERDVLESQRDEVIGTSAQLVNTTPEDDAALEKELESARARAFQLEAAAAMRMERDFDVQISEAVMRNRSLAARLRAVLQEQLETQKLGAATQAKRTTTRRRLEDGARTLTRLQQKLSAIEHERGLVEGAMKTTDEQLVATRGDVQRLKSQQTDSQLASRDQLHQQKKLVEACEELDARIVEMRKRTVSGAHAMAQQECQRLRQEQRSLVQKLAVAEAATSRSELRVRKLIIAHEHAVGERRRVFDKVALLAKRRVTLAQRQMDEFEVGLGYSGVNREELERLAASVEGQYSTRRAAIATESQQVAQLLRAKLKVIDTDGAVLRSSTKEFTEFAHDRKRDADHEAKQEAQVTEWIVETFDGLDESHANSSSGKSVSRLIEKVRGAVQSNARLLDLLSTVYTSELVDEPTLEARNSSTSTRRPGSSRGALSENATDASMSTGQMNQVERAARKSYRGLAKSISAQFEQPPKR